jgi:alpha-N-arabinofuranosidase
MKAHRSKKSLRTENPDTSPLGLSVSASREGNELVLTLVNPKHDATLQVNCSLAGASAAGATARILHHEDMNACNTFSDPDRIVPRSLAVSASGSSVTMDLPPLSVATAVVGLG